MDVISARLEVYLSEAHRINQVDPEILEETVSMLVLGAYCRGKADRKAALQSVIGRHNPHDKIHEQGNFGVTSPQPVSESSFGQDADQPGGSQGFDDSRGTTDAETGEGKGSEKGSGASNRPRSDHKDYGHATKEENSEKEGDEGSSELNGSTSSPKDPGDASQEEDADEEGIGEESGESDKPPSGPKKDKDDEHDPSSAAGSHGQQGREGALDSQNSSQPPNPPAQEEPKGSSNKSSQSQDSDLETLEKQGQTLPQRPEPSHPPRSRTREDELVSRDVLYDPQRPAKSGLGFPHVFPDSWPSVSDGLAARIQPDLPSSRLHDWNLPFLVNNAGLDTPYIQSASGDGLDQNLSADSTRLSDSLVDPATRLHRRSSFPFRAAPTSHFSAGSDPLGHAISVPMGYPLQPASNGDKIVDYLNEQEKPSERVWQKTIDLDAMHRHHHKRRKLVRFDLPIENHQPKERQVPVRNSGSFQKPVVVSKL
jgi:hypothetical protein